MGARFNMFFPFLLISVLTISWSCSFNEIVVGPPRDFQIKELNPGNIKLVLFLPIENTNNLSFNVISSDINVYLNNRKLGEVNQIEKFRIAKNSHDVYPVLFEIETSDALGSMISVIRDFQSTSPRIGLKGNIRAGRLMIVKNIEVNHEQIFYVY